MFFSRECFEQDISLAIAHKTFQICIQDWNGTCPLFYPRVAFHHHILLIYTYTTHRHVLEYQHGKTVASMGIEPTTFALLARRSNQLS